MIPGSWSTELPPELLERLWIAASEHGLCEDEIAAAAIDLFPAEHGH